MNSFKGFESVSWNSLDVINVQVATDKFHRLNRQARLAKFWHRLTGRSGTLVAYEQMHAQTKGITSLDRGVKVIPLESIVGSVGRAADYDRQFRPLNPALENRWINVHVLSERSGWEPITVRKIGDLYFVEDGHHRVSVARHSGWDYIEAQVYESPL